MKLVNFLFQDTAHRFSHRNVTFGLIESCTIRNRRQFVTVKEINFWQFFNMTMVILEIFMACDLSF